MDTKIIPWSGGLDSTVVLFDTLEEIKDYPYRKVHVVSVNCPQFFAEGTSIKEKEAREKIKEKIKERYEGVVIEYSEFEVSTAEVNFPADPPIFGQLPLILSSVFAVLEQGSEIRFGYVKGDTIVPYVNNVLDMIFTYVQMGKYSNEMKQVGVTFPLLQETKREVTLKAIEYGILSLVYSCTEASETIKDCDCKKCKELVENLERIDQDIKRGLEEEKKEN